MSVQSVVIPSKWGLHAAKHWLLSNGYGYKKVHETPHTYRFRQFDPPPDGRYYTKALPNGVLLVVLKTGRAG